MFNKFSAFCLSILILQFGIAQASELEVSQSWVRSSANKTVQSPISGMLCNEVLAGGYKLTKAHEYSAFADTSCSYINDKRTLITIYIYSSPYSFEAEIRDSVFPVLEKFGPKSSIVSEDTKIVFAGREITGRKLSAENRQRNTTEALSLYDLQNSRFKVRATSSGADSSIDLAVREFANLQIDAFDNIQRCKAFPNFASKNAKLANDMADGIMTITTLGEVIKEKSTLSVADSCNFAYIGKSGEVPIILRLRNPQSLSLSVESFDFSGAALASIQPNPMASLLGSKANYALVSYEEKSAKLYQMYESLPSLEQAADGLIKVIKGEMPSKFAIEIDAKGKSNIIVSSPPPK